MNNSYSQDQLREAQLLARAARITVTRGRMIALVEVFKTFATIPEKLLLWDRTVGSGELNEDSEQLAKVFLAMHHSTDTHISINEYNPFLICKRVYQNSRASLLSKLTLGILEIISYTFPPAKLFGGDYYLPIADTIVICSDNLSIALHESGHAIDFTERNRNGLGPGLYSIMRILPPVMLYQEAVATRKAISFAESCGEQVDIKHCWSLLIPAFGTYVAYVIHKHTEVNYLPLLISVMLAAHVLGRIANAVRTSRCSYKVDKDLAALVERVKYGEVLSTQ